MRYDIRAEYKTLKLLEVDVDEGKDAEDPANWNDIISEQDADCCLYDILKAEAND